MADNAFKDVIPSFRFMLIVNGYDEIPCKSIKPFSRELEYEYVQEGGLNDYVHILRKPASKPFTIQVERYAIPQTEDPISEGTVYQLPMQLVVGENHGMSFERKRTYLLLWPRILNKEIGSLDAERSGLLTETVTIAYSHMILMHHETKGSGYKFERGKTKPAFGLGAYKKVEANEMEKKTFEEAAQNGEPWKWDSEGSWRGDGKRRATTNKSERRKGTMRQNAKTFNFGTKDDTDDKTNFTLRAKTFAFGTKTLKEKEDFDTKSNANKWLWGKSADDFLGTGKRNANTNSNETRLTDRKSAAINRAWRYEDKDSNNTDGMGQQNASHISGELSSDKMLEKANKLDYGSISPNGDKNKFLERASKSVFGAAELSDKAKFLGNAREYSFGTNAPNQKEQMISMARKFVFGQKSTNDSTAFIEKARKFSFGTKNSNDLPGFISKSKKYSFGSLRQNDKAGFLSRIRNGNLYGSGIKDERSGFLAKAKAFSFGTKSGEEALPLFLSRTKKYEYGSGTGNDKEGFLSKAKNGYLYGSGIKDERSGFLAKAKTFSFGTKNGTDEQPLFLSNTKKYEFGNFSGKDKEDFLAKVRSFSYGSGGGTDQNIFLAKAKRFAFGAGKGKDLQAFLKKAKKTSFGGSGRNDKSTFLSKAKTTEYDRKKNGNSRSRFSSKVRKNNIYQKDKSKNNNAQKRFMSKAKTFNFGSGKDKKDRPEFEAKARLWPKQSSAMTVKDFLKS